MRKNLFIKEMRAYIKIAESCEPRSPILGAIEIAPNGFEGTLNAKDSLVKLISQAGGNFTGLPDFSLANQGLMRRGAGTGFHGWVDFQARTTAIKYLENYFDLAWCRNEEGLDEQVVVAPAHRQTIKIVLEWKRYNSFTPWLQEDHIAEATINGDQVDLRVGIAHGINIGGGGPQMHPTIIDDARRITIIQIAHLVVANPNKAVNQFNNDAVAHVAHVNPIIVRVFVGPNNVLDWAGDGMDAEGLLGQLLAAMI